MAFRGYQLDLLSQSIIQLVGERMISCLFVWSAMAQGHNNNSKPALYHPKPLRNSTYIYIYIPFTGALQVPGLQWLIPRTDILDASNWLPADAPVRLKLPGCSLSSFFWAPIPKDLLALRPKTRGFQKEMVWEVLGSLERAPLKGI